MLKDLLQRKNKSIYALAKKCGARYASIHNLITGKSSYKNCTVQIFKGMSDALDMTMDELYEECYRDELNEKKIIDGKPMDKNYLECDLPAFLQKSIDDMKEVWRNWDEGLKLPDWDCRYCCLQSDINCAETDMQITEEQAWYLREKYLRMKKEETIC